jgi:hypothetical protein
MLMQVLYNLQTDVDSTIDLLSSIIEAMARRMLITVGESTKVCNFDGALTEDVMKQVIKLLH